MEMITSLFSVLFCEFCVASESKNTWDSDIVDEAALQWCLERWECKSCRDLLFLE